MYLMNNTQCKNVKNNDASTDSNLLDTCNPKTEMNWPMLSAMVEAPYLIFSKQTCSINTSNIPHSLPQMRWDTQKESGQVPETTPCELEAARLTRDG